MPKHPGPKLVLNLNLLKPQSDPEKLPVQFLHWLLSSGRYIFIFVEAIVLIAFAARFKLDEDLSSQKDAIDQQVPYIQSLKTSEILIRQTQLKLSTIDNAYKTIADYPNLLIKFSSQMPIGVKVIDLTMEKDANKVNIRLNGQSQSNTDLSNLLLNLKQDSTFSNVNIYNVSVEKGIINFSLTADAKLGEIL